MKQEVTLDRSKLLGYRIEVEGNGAKIGDKNPTRKMGSKVGVKADSPSRIGAKIGEKIAV